MGSSGWSLGLWWRPNSPGDPGLVKLCDMGPHYSEDSHNKLHGKHDKWEGDRCLGNAFSKYSSGLSPSSHHDDKVAARESDPSDYNEVVTTKDTETIGASSSHVIHARMRTAHTGEGINVMNQALHTEDGYLPQGLTVQNAYTELCSSSKNVTLVVRNSMAYPKTLRKKTLVARAVVVTWVPVLPVQTEEIEALAEPQVLYPPKLTWSQGKRSCLRSWT